MPNMQKMSIFEVGKQLHDNLGELRKLRLPKFFHDLTLEQDRLNNRKYEAATDRQHAYNVERCAPLMIELVKENHTINEYDASALLADRVLMSLFGMFKDFGYFEDAMNFLANVDFRKVRNLNKYIHSTMSRWISEDMNCDLKEMMKNVSTPKVKLSIKAPPTLVPKPAASVLPTSNSFSVMDSPPASTSSSPPPITSIPVMPSPPSSPPTSIVIPPPAVTPIMIPPPAVTPMIMQPLSQPKPKVVLPAPVVASGSATIIPAEVRMKAAFLTAFTHVLKDEPHRLIKDTTFENTKVMAVQQSNGQYCIMSLLTNVDSLEGFMP